MLNIRWKKLLLSFHVIFACIWIGCLFSITILLLYKTNFFNPAEFEIVDKIIFIIHDKIIINSSLLMALTGLLFSTFTQWGFIKYWWIIIKWIGIITLAILIMFFSAPSVNGMAALSNVYNSPITNFSEYSVYNSDAILYFIIQVLSLIIIVFISVFKPWGQRQIKNKISRKLLIMIVVTIILFTAAGAVIQYLQLNFYRNLIIDKVELTNLQDGDYYGSTESDFEYKVKVKIINGTITDIEILNNRNSLYAKLAENIKFKIINSQQNNVDVVTGASTTSKILMKAVENALLKSANN